MSINSGKGRRRRTLATTSDVCSTSTVGLTRACTAQEAGLRTRIVVHGSDGEEAACSAGDPSSGPGSGRSPGGGRAHPLQHSCLETPMDRGAGRDTVHGVAKSQARLSDTHRHTFIRSIKTGKTIGLKTRNVFPFKEKREGNNQVRT